MELRLKCLLAGSAMAATLMLNGCGDDDHHDHHAPPPPVNNIDITYGHPKFLPDGRIIGTRFSTDTSTSPQTTSMDIVIMNADGSGLVNLTPNTDTTNEFYPSVNIDGTKIAFATNRNGHFDIYIGALSGTTLTNLVNLTGDVDYDCWRPSFGIVDTSTSAQATEAIAFMATPPPSNSFQVWSMKADGSEKTALAAIAGGSAIQGVFSPDGSKLLFVKQVAATGSQIIEEDLQSGALTELVSDPTSKINAFTPSYSPDGTKIAYHDDRDGIHVMNTDGTNNHFLPSTTPTDTTPSWNSSGTKIVFDRGWNKHDSIWVMNPDGSGQTLVQAEEIK